MEPLKHECGVAIVRLRKPLQYYKEKYGTYTWGLDKLYLLMEKQHNRGQEAAGVGVVKLLAPPGDEYLYRSRALGAGAIADIFTEIRHDIDAFGPDRQDANPDEVAALCPYLGEIYMGHLRYSTTGRSGLSYVHPFLRRNNWRSRNLMLMGNFNMTNVDALFDTVVSRGQHPRIYSDTIVLLEQLGYALDRENHRIYRELRGQLEEPQLSQEIERRVDVSRMLASTAPAWDGGYVICGSTGSGDTFALRDPHGIRPAFYYIDDEVIVLASERPVIQTVMNVPRSCVNELRPGSALIITPSAEVEVNDVLGEAENARCSFERIYFSRGSDADIYRERKALGRELVPRLMEMLDGDLDNTIFSFIPNTAEVAFLGMTEGLGRQLDRQRSREILELAKSGKLDSESLEKVMDHRLRIEKIALKDIKLRTFIAEGPSRSDLAAHVYDVTYGCCRDGIDTIVAIDDSIVRGTTLSASIIRMLDRLCPRRLIIASSSPQVRYPDYYGIDMSRLGEFAAFRAAVSLLRARGMERVLDEVYQRCLASTELPDGEVTNCVKAVYEPFSIEEISAEMARMLTPAGTRASVDLLFPTIEQLHRAIPGHPGDWYFSGDYPTPGGCRAVNRAFVNYYRGLTDAR